MSKISHSWRPKVVMVSQFGQCTYFNFIIDYNIIVSQIHTIKEPLLIPREGGERMEVFYSDKFIYFTFNFQSFRLSHSV